MVIKFYVNEGIEGKGEMSTYSYLDCFSDVTSSVGSFSRRGRSMFHGGGDADHQESSLCRRTDELKMEEEGMNTTVKSTKIKKDISKYLHYNHVRTDSNP